MINRRDFLKYSTQLAALSVFSQTSVANEAKKQKLAKITFSFSSPYKTADYATTPHAHLEIKALIEQYTHNKIYVEIRDNGRDGIGTSLANSVRFGTTNCALISASNLTPRIPELDILNIPFWSANPKDYIRLCQSNVWQRHIVKKFAKYNYAPLLHYVVGARTASTTKKYSKRIVKPKDFIDVAFRIPGSRSLQIFYKLTGARPQSIPWGLTAATARAGRFDALDSSITGLYSGPNNLRQEIGVISDIESVHDGWIAIANLDFINALDTTTKRQFLEAWEAIQQAQLIQYAKAQKRCSDEFIKIGTEIYQPSKAQKKDLAKAFGHERPEWDAIKKHLLGEDGMIIFDGMHKAAKG